MNVKDPIPGGLRSCVVYKFTCVGCNACYVGETTRRFSTCVCEHWAVDKASHILKHLQNSERCCSLCSIDCFLNFRSRNYQLSSQDKGGCPCSKRTTLPQSAITPCKSKIILLIYTFSRSFTHFHVLLLLFVLISIFVYLLFNLLCKSFNWRWQKF